MSPGEKAEGNQSGDYYINPVERLWGLWPAVRLVRGKMHLGCLEVEPI